MTYQRAKALTCIAAGLIGAAWGQARLYLGVPWWSLLVLVVVIYFVSSRIARRAIRLPR
jgi:hypothetical protein